MKHLFFILSQQARSFVGKVVTLLFPIANNAILVRTNMGSKAEGVRSFLHLNTGTRADMNQKPAGVRGNLA